MDREGKGREAVVGSSSFAPSSVAPGGAMEDSVGTTEGGCSLRTLHHRTRAPHQQRCRIDCFLCKGNSCKFLESDTLCGTDRILQA